MSYRESSIMSASIDFNTEERKELLRQISCQSDHIVPQLSSQNSVSNNDAGDGPYDNERGQTESNQQKQGETVKQQVVYILEKAFPCSLQNLVYYICKLTTISIIGHYGTTVDLSAVSLGSTFANVTGYSVIQGLVSVLDTYCSQSFTGNKQMTGVYLQKCYVVTSFVSIFIALFWMFSGPVFMALQIEDEVSMLTQAYLRCLIFGLPANIIFQGVQRFLQAQRIFYPICFIQLACLPVYLGVQILFVNIGFGFIGAPLAVSLCDTIVAVAVVIYAMYFDGYQAWSGFTWQAFTGLSEYLYLSVGSVVQVCSNWWAFELTTIACGWISVTALATQSVMMSTFSLLFSLQFGISVAVSNKLGNNLGLGKAREAKTLTRIALGMTLASSSTIAMILILIRRQWGQVFTNSEEVNAEVVKVLPVAAVAGILDGVQITMNGVLRGTARQAYGAVVNTICYYLIGLPFAFTLAFYFHLGLLGIWYGLFVGLSFQIVLLLTYAFNMDFQKASKEAKDRVMQTQGQNALTEPLNA